jgi:hypothetical protein
MTLTTRLSRALFVLSSTLISGGLCGYSIAAQTIVSRSVWRGLSGTSTSKADSLVLLLLRRRACISTLQTR